MSINKDLLAVSRGSKAKAIITVLFDPGYKAVRNYRKAHWLHQKLGLQFLPRYLTYRNKVKYSVDIDFRAKIGEGFRIIHGGSGGIVIGKNVVAGNNLSLHQGVTIGGNGGKNKTLEDGTVIDQPLIKDEVSIMTGAIVLGPVILGEKAVIGAGSMVMKDVPRDAVVYSKSELIIKQKD